MHYHLEVIIPADRKDISGDIEQILKPFNENEDENKHAFYDWYTIGGRFSGEKILQALDKKKLDKFYKDLNKEEVKVSSFRAGKETLAGKEHEIKVDELWLKHFPDSKTKCPIFDNYNDKYKNSLSYPDVMKVGDIPEKLTAARVIVAVPKYDEDNLVAETMLEDSYWNGVSWNDTKFDRKVSTAIKKHNDSFKNAEEKYKEKRIVTDKWITVTVDYHD